MDDLGAPHGQPDGEIAELKKEVILLQKQVKMLFELGLSATETLEATIRGKEHESNDRLQHLVSQLRPFALTLTGESDG